MRDEVAGGLISAAVAVPLAMGYGMFAFTSLGDPYFAYGALSGLCSAVVAGVVCVLLGDRTTTVYAPRVTTTFFLGVLLFQLTSSSAAVARAGGLHVIVLAFFAIVLLAGAIQAVFGWTHLGSVLRFTPHPVLAGLQNAAALLLFLVQLGNACGFDAHVPFRAVPAHLAEAKPLSLVVVLVTFVVMWNARRFTAKVPPLLVGFGAGTVLYFALVAAGLGAQLGPVIGMPIAARRPAPVDHILDVSAADVDAFRHLLPLVGGGAVALALVASIDTLLCVKLVTPTGAPRTDANRLLVRLGLGNLLAATAGGITSGINIGPSIANRAFGARTPLSVLINAAVLLAVALLLFPIASYMPRAVLSAVIMVVAVQHVDPWSIDLVRRLRSRTSRHRTLMALDLLVVAVVAILSVTINIVLAVFIGFVLAVAMFIVRMSRSNIRRRYRCDTVHSRKARPPRDTARVEAQGAKILVLELQGVLFFGSADTLAEEIQRETASPTRSVILDLRRVTEIDATGARTLGDIHLSLASRHQRLALAIAMDSEPGARLAEAGVIDGIGADRVFGDVDRALEWAEDDLLREDADIAAADFGELALAAVDLLSGLTPAELAVLETHVRPVTYSRGSVIFREGDPGTELFIVTKGRASVRLRQPSRHDIRLATFAPGTVFGELAILDAGPRSASVVADEDMHGYVLSDERFRDLMSGSPPIAMKLLASLGRELSRRLRRANRTIHQLES